MNSKKKRPDQYLPICELEADGAIVRMRSSLDLGENRIASLELCFTQEQADVFLKEFTRIISEVDVNISKGAG